MPPKKDPKKDPKGKGKDAKAKEEEYEPVNPCDFKKPKEPELADEIDDATKEKYLAQIDNCTERLKLLQRQADLMEVRAGFYPNQFEQIVVDKKDLVSYLEWCLENREAELEALKQYFEEFKIEKQATEERQQKELEDFRNEFQTMKQELTQEKEALQAKLEPMKEVEEEKQLVLDTIDAHIKELADRQAAHEENMYQKERSGTMEIELIKRTINDRIKAVAQECTLLGQKKLEQIVKQSLMETAEAIAKIDSHFSDEMISHVLQINTMLTAKTEENRRVIEILESKRVSLDKKNQREQQSMKKIMEEIKQQELVYLDFRYQQTERDIRHEILYIKDQLHEQKRNQARERKKQKELKEKLMTTNEMMKLTGITNRNLYEALLDAMGDFNMILQPQKHKFLHELEVLATEDVCDAMEPLDIVCPDSEKVHILKKDPRFNKLQKHKFAIN